MFMSTRSVPTRLVALLAAVALAVTVLPRTGLADGPVIEQIQFEVVDEPIAVCAAGTPDEFTILSSYVFEARAILFEGTVDEPVNVIFHARLSGTLTNTVTGSSLDDQAHGNHVYNAYRGTHLIAGIEYLTTLPGQGVVVANVGLLEYGLTEDGEVLIAAHGPHDVLEGGVEVFCPYLA
jgi:hypothetical protein